MDKLEVFKNLYGNLKKIKQLKLSKRIELQGNLAFFVDCYYGTDKWESLIGDIRKRVEEKEMNEVCWLLSSAICTGFEENYLSRDYTADKRLAEVNNAIDLSLYKEKILDDFDIVEPKFYPNFFYNCISKKDVEKVKALIKHAYE